MIETLLCCFFICLLRKCNGKKEILCYFCFEIEVYKVIQFLVPIVLQISYLLSFVVFHECFNIIDL